MVERKGFYRVQYNSKLKLTQTLLGTNIFSRLNFEQIKRYSNELSIRNVNKQSLPRLILRRTVLAKMQLMCQVAVRDNV